MNHRAFFRRLTAAGAAAVLLAPITSAVADTNGSVPKIAWGSCGTDPKLKAFQCATVEVPTDYDKPNGATTTIALTRLPATDPTQRIGTLFNNPGGPGGSGVDFVHQLGASAYSTEVRARFDILGFDPRGVAGSDPVTCFPTAAEEAAAMSKLPAFPLGRAQERQFTATMATVAASCERTSPDRLAHFSTANVARDMDLLRQAVGDEKLTYVGYSYGTYLGATYAKLFPSKVRALVLDGTWYPSEYSGTPGDPRPVGVRLGQGPAAAKTFEQFKAECKRAGASRCALAGLGDPDTVAEGLLEQLKKKPVVLPGPNGPFEVTYAAMVRSTFTSLYQPDLWTDLAAAFTEVAQAAGTAQNAQTAQAKAAKLSARSAALLQPDQRQEDYPSFGSLLQNCVEAYTPMQPGAYPAWAAAVDAVAPHFGRMRTWQSVQCETMPTRDKDSFRGPWTKLKVSEPVLVIGTRYDPATPYADTRPYAELYRDARMVTVEGFGHTTLGKSTCADRLITEYLTSLRAPADGSTCTQDRKPFTPAPAKTKLLQGPGQGAGR